MKLLMIGMDGAHIDAFKRGWTPFLAKVMKQADHLPINEDLISRGWSKIVLGQHGATTGANYDRPNLDGTHGWSLKFQIKDVPRLGSQVKPIWQVLSENGIRVGVMNVPTMFPAPEVNGFAVSGGGGGGPVVQEPTMELCYPQTILPTLRELGYIVDERPTSLIAEKGYNTATQLFERMAVKNEKRTDAFLRLSENFSVEFGFLVYKSSSILAETLVLTELAAAKTGGVPSDDLMQSAEDYYRHFDKQVQRLFNAYQNADILLVSDHGSVAITHLFNPNALLHQLGYQPSAVQGKESVAKFARTIKGLIPYSIRHKVRTINVVRKNWEAISTSIPDGARAFSLITGSWPNGIFVNDSERFGGPVDPGDISSLCDEIITAINESSLARSHGISAKQRPISRDEGSPHYPDIVVFAPDGTHFSAESGEPVTTFKMPKAPLGVKSVMEGKLLTIKSSNALAANAKGVWNAENENATDLTEVYYYILRYFTKNI